MKPEMLELKLRQCMKPGMPYYLKQINTLTGLELSICENTLERYIRDVDCVYWRKIGDKKLYYIDAIELEPCIFARLHDWLVKTFIEQRRRFNRG